MDLRVFDLFLPFLHVPEGDLHTPADRFTHTRSSIYTLRTAPRTPSQLDLHVPDTVSHAPAPRFTHSGSRFTQTRSPSDTFRTASCTHPQVDLHVPDRASHPPAARFHRTAQSLARAGAGLTRPFPLLAHTRSRVSSRRNAAAPARSNAAMLPTPIDASPVRAKTKSPRLAPWAGNHLPVVADDYFFFAWTFAATFRRRPFRRMKPVASSWLYALVGSASIVAMCGL